MVGKNKNNTYSPFFIPTGSNPVTLIEVFNPFLPQTHDSDCNDSELRPWALRMLPSHKQAAACKHRFYPTSTTVSVCVCILYLHSGTSRSFEGAMCLQRNTSCICKRARAGYTCQSCRHVMFFWIVFCGGGFPDRARLWMRWSVERWETELHGFTFFSITR